MSTLSTASSNLRSANPQETNTASFSQPCMDYAHSKQKPHFCLPHIGLSERERFTKSPVGANGIKTGAVSIGGFLGQSCHPPCLRESCLCVSLSGIRACRVHRPGVLCPPECAFCDRVPNENASFSMAGLLCLLIEACIASQLQLRGLMN